MTSFLGNAQTMQVNILGGAQISNGGTLTINAGNSVTFQITNTETGNCRTVNVTDINISNTANFSITDSNPSANIRPATCNGTKVLDFTVTATGSACATTTTRVTIEGNNFANFWFDLTVVRAPIISVLGGTPSADIINGATATTATNGTYFGVVEEGFTVVRRYYIVNTGSCPLNISSIASSHGEFTVTTPIGPIPSASPNIAVGGTFFFDVTFTAGSAAGTFSSTISIANNDSNPLANPYTFVVRAEVFNFSGPGPGGITADFRLWLKATRGVVKDVSNNVSKWKDLGTNPKDAIQPTAINQPTLIDSYTGNINFNPVVQFVNGGGTEEYLYNLINGFYSQDIFIVMIPDVTITSSSNQQAIFGGIKSNLDSPTPAGTITGVGFGNYTSSFTNETLTYMQESTSSYGIAEISTTKSYANAGIINVRNNGTSATAQEILYNSNLLSTTTINSGSFANVGHLEPDPPNPDIVWGTKYWIGKNFSETGSLNGRVAEIMTFAQRVPDADRPKIESYLAIKYGITLGATKAEKNYVNSAGTVIWDYAANDGFNYNVAGIGRDDNSDLNQKQSKSINEINEVIIGLGAILPTNSANTNEFKVDKEFLVWGCNNEAFNGSSTNTTTIGTGVTTTLTRIARIWKIKGTGANVSEVYIGVPTTAFGSFSLNADEEYALIVSNTPSFLDTDIIDVIPLKSNPYGLSILQTWYDFEGTKFFTFGKVPKVSASKMVNIGAGDFLVGEYSLNLNPFAFTVSAWVKGDNTASIRTILAKGTKLQLRLNALNKIEVMVDDDLNPRFTSNMILDDLKWHHITFVYQSGTIFLYVDGVLDQSTQNVNPPTPNFNRFSIGAVYVDAHTVTSPFLGEIDEVYVWNLALTGDQVNYLMNQEIVKNGALVRGKVIPKDITTMPWAYLAAYYNFNSFYGTTVEGQTTDRFFLRINYRASSKTIVGTQTAPLPYITQQDGGSWDTPETWLNYTVQNIPNSASLKSGTDVDGNIVRISHNITSGDRNITVLGLISTEGKLTIDGDNTLGTGQGLRVTHYLELDGSIDLVGESQLVQDEGSILDNDSGGFIERDQQGTANSFNYNYWSSALGPITAGGVATRGTGIASTNAPFTVKGIINDGRASTPPSIVFGTSPYAADATPGAQLTISNYWLYQFYGKDDDYNSWFPRINENSPLEPGVGYTMKGSLGAVPITTNQNYVFKGKPYNGDFTLKLEKTHITPSGDVDRLIGNPYPSAIDATEFILDNLSIADGGRNIQGNIFNGALYFWDHFGEKNSHILKAYVGGYATRNLTAGAPAISNDSRINNSGGPSNANTVGKIPGQYIPVNQGFFVVTKLDGFLNNNDVPVPVASVSGGDIVFKNSQRVFQRESAIIGGPSTFMKPVKTKGKITQNKIETNINIRPIIRLMFDSPTGYHRQIVAGMVENKSNHFDLGYDAPIADINKEDMFWIFDNAKFVIQAVGNFNTDQELPLGVKIAKAGLATIKIDELENLDENISLHIKDKLTGETHNISQKDFQIELGAGDYFDRFVLIFKMQKLVAEDVAAEVLIVKEQIIVEGIHVFMDNSIGELQIKNNSPEEILSVELFNSLGQRINNWNKNLNRRIISLPINTATGVYIAQINTKTGKTVKKISIEAP